MLAGRRDGRLRCINKTLVQCPDELHGAKRYEGSSCAEKPSELTIHHQFGGEKHGKTLVPWAMQLV